MYIVYMDESGDDGYPGSSNLFELTSIYLHANNWKVAFESHKQFRIELKRTFGIPIKMEIHTKEMMLNKGNFRSFDFSNQRRYDIAKSIAQTIGVMAEIGVKCINVGINKKNIDDQNNQHYVEKILHYALKFNVQRIETSVINVDPNSKFLIISDEGRVGKMCKTTREMQAINLIPSMYGNGSINRQISLMVEDPLPKKSNASYFIQICDFVSFFVYIYLMKRDNIGEWHNRLQWLTYKQLDEILELLSPIFNTAAHRQDKYGIVTYPKNK